MNETELHRLLAQIRDWASELGFQQLTVSDLNMQDYANHLDDWLARGDHGEMEYMARHRDLRIKPTELHPGSLRALCVRMDYSLLEDQSLKPVLDREQAYISRYARGRDYHKLIRKRLQQLATRISEHIGEFGYRAFVDSAPVMERALAEKSGMGWIGKNTCLLYTSPSPRDRG